MADKDVKALRDDVDRRFGKIEAELKSIASQIEGLGETDKALSKAVSNEIAQGRREDRDATAETVEQGVGQAADVARSEARETGAELRQEVVDAFNAVANAARDVL